MDKQTKEILKKLKDSEIGPDDKFRFHCTMCGKCCRHRDDILLNPKDIYNMARELGITPRELLQQYCESYIGEGSRMPIVRLRPRGSVQRCPMHRDLKCRVHNAKPAVCAMFPIGRYILPEKVSNGKTKRIQYLFMNPDCGDDSEVHTVREWLGIFGIPVDDGFFIKWQETAMELVRILAGMEKENDEAFMEKVWTKVLEGVYLDYKTDADFMMQFEKNMEDTFAILRDGRAGEGGNNNGNGNDTV